MRRFLWIIAPHLGLAMFFFFGFLVENYVRIEPSLREIQHNRKALVSYFLESESNWYQKRMALEWLSRLECKEGDSLIRAVLDGHVIQNRTAVLEGCLSQVSGAWVLPFGLRDSQLSYNQVIALEFIQKHGLQPMYKEWLQALLQAKSTMVAKKAQAVLQASVTKH